MILPFLVWWRKRNYFGWVLPHGFVSPVAREPREFPPSSFPPAQQTTPLSCRRNSCQTNDISTKRSYSVLMSATFPDHERSGSSVVHNSIPQSGGQMEQVTQARPFVGDNAKSPAVATGPARPTGSGTSETPGSSLGTKQETRSEPMKTRSLDYILRSGCAGGLAGCTVSWNRFSPLATCP